MTKTLEEKIAGLKKEHSEDLERKVDDLILRYKIDQELPDVGLKWSVYTGTKLWGSCASVKVEHDFFRYSENEGEKQPDIHTVIAVSKALPPISLTKCKDSCLSYRPTEFVESMPESKKEHWVEENVVSPFIMEYDIFQNPSLTFKWFTKLENVGIMSVSVILRITPEFGFLSPVYQFNNSHRGYNDNRITSMNFQPCQETITIFDEDDTPVANRNQHVTWASGDESTPRRCSLTWENLDYFKVPTIENLLTPILKKMEENTKCED